MTLRAIFSALLFLLAAPLLAQSEEFLPLTAPVELAQDQPDIAIGELIFRGGVEIAPDKAQIGGISGLEWHDGQLYAVTDDGRWLVLTPENVQGRLVDVSQVTIGPLLDERGRKLGGKERGDAEGITRLASGEWLVSFEQEHRIWRYPAIGAAAAGSEDHAAALVAGAEANSGIETIAAYAGGLFACGEWIDPARPNCLRITPQGTQAFALAAPEGIAEAGGVPTDAACAEDGTCYVLLRSYRRGEGNRAAIVEMAPDNTPETLAVLTPPLTLDNFEGLAFREEAGRKFLYVISDDNFNNCDGNERPDCQRTLLMKFEIKGNAPPPGAPVVVSAAPATKSTARPGTRPFPEAASVNVVLTTELGDITIALETERAPVTAANFLRYVDEKRFDGTVFYRAMRLDREPRPNGLLQGGTQFDPKRILPGIPHEPTSQTGLTHTHGALSMAMGEPGSANGDFSIMIEDQTGLDADPAASDPVWRNGYAVFGYVVDGMDVVAAIHASEIDPDKGEGWMKGEILAKPVKIISVRRAPAE
ncbi:peptidylprolyl isomerase [Erythrobacter sp. sf7]|uniref:peptidylprolyl isomerase n=1 Tax=Erythrobacter fulvus TaxID=2987523 RepID=A0ABT5JLJ2_9SPHN|nr:esterase-like activity of phytase family protein [Erythrobacter fulvus]MDC8753484.1 peptidylprolyl isomerase [Erythrobacter fulvus]